MHLIEANSADKDGAPQKVVALITPEGDVVGPVLYNDLAGRDKTLNSWSRMAGAPSDNVTAAVWNDYMEQFGVDGWRYDENFVLGVPLS